MNEVLTKSQVEDFLEDFKVNSSTIILEEGKEKSDILKIAKAQGYDLKNSRSLAGFKTVYAFSTIANKNRVRLNKKGLLKALPSMRGKPVNIDHLHGYVIGHLIDYRYIQKEDKVIAYGVFYKANFATEWEKVQALFKAGKLATSYEVFCPKDKRRFLEDGTEELLQPEIAGDAILIRENPAFEGAVMLELAKKKTSNVGDLVFASDKYKGKETELIICGSDKFSCDCPKCGYKTISTKHCRDIKCPKCGESLRRQGRPGTGNPDKRAEDNTQKNDQPQTTKIKCDNCGEEIDLSLVDINAQNIKCAKCKAILDRKGQMLYPPQVQNFNLLCPACSINDWLIKEQNDEESKIKCNSCSAEYKIGYQADNDELAKKYLKALYVGTTNCLQCGNSISYGGVSHAKELELKCDECGLTFKFNAEKISKYRSIGTIQRIDTVVKSSHEGGQKMGLKIEVTKFHRYVNEAIDLETACLDLDYDKDFEKASKAKKLTKESRKALPNSMFAVVKKVKDKKNGQFKTVRMFLIHDKAHVINSLESLAKEESKEILKSLGIPVEAIKKVILAKAKQFKMKDFLEKNQSSKELTSEQKKDLKIKELEKAQKESTEKLTTVNKEIETVKIKANEKVELYKSNAKTIYERRQLLGTFAEEFKDEEILNDDKFEKAMLEKEVMEGNTGNENDTSLETAVDKSSQNNESPLDTFAKEVQSKSAYSDSTKE